MRRIKLFMMLALLVAGVGVTWAQQTQTFDVVYTGRTTSQGAGFTATTGATISYRDGWSTYTVSIQSFTSNTIVVTGQYARTDRTIYNTYLPNYITPNEVTGYSASVSVSGTTVTIAYAPMTIKYRVLWDKEFVQGGGYTLTGTNPTNATLSKENGGDILVITGTNGNPPTRWDDNTNLSTYISPIPVTGYTTGLYFMPNETQLGYEGTIYVNYHTTATENKWTDDNKIYDYSNIYTRETGSTILLPDDECAISLHLGTDELVHETKYYYRKFIIIRNNRYYLNNQNVLDENNNSLPTTVGGTATYDGATYKLEEISQYYSDLKEKYSYDGQEYEVYGFGYKYTVDHTIKVSTVENAVIPLVDPKYGKKVTAIQKWGFCYEMNDVEQPYGCPTTKADGTMDKTDIRYNYAPSIDNHSNWHLKTVTFEKDANGQSNLESIGDYAFMSCKELTDVEIPFSVKYMGQGIFEQDTKLENVNFQTGEITRNGKTYPEGVQFTTLRMFTFWKCFSLETLVLPDGITDIEGQQAGAALQYLTSLINISLPSTLERIGPHFLCCASALRTLTIPNSVTYIDGAAFHGCESLESVYILGPAANLQGEFAEVGSDQTSSTFSANATYCKETVNNCTFYTTDDNLAGYKNDPVWSRIDENGTYNPSNGQWGNTLTTIPAEKRVIPTTWVTALFPQGVENYADDDVFGEGTLVAVMDKCDSFTSKVINGKTTRIYQLTFKLLEGTDIPANRPVLIKAGTAKEYTFYTDADKQEDWWKNNSDVFFFTPDDQVTAPDGAKITMKGRYLPHQLQPWDFYFMYENKVQNEDGTVTYPTEPAKFYRVPDQKNAATIKACRCWWTISVDGIKSKAPAMAKTMNSFFFDEATGIKNVDAVGVVVKGIYDMQGRKLDIKESELPQGLYIVNGKKVVKK